MTIQNKIRISKSPLSSVIQLLSYTLLLLLLLLQQSTSVNGSELSFNCPVDCECTTANDDYNHAKCTSLDGLKQIGKTSTIQSLDISNIQLTKITNQLDKLTNLTKLDVSNNRLSEVFKLTKRIKDLDLSNNRITSGKLSKIPLHVQHLNLSNNDITYLPLELKKLLSLKTIDLSGNPINCTCETLQVRNFLQDNFVWTDSPVTCSAPIKAKGRPWLQIKQIDMCPASSLLDDQELTPLPYNNLDESENELMLGDQPIYDDEKTAADEDDEIGEKYLPVKSMKVSPSSESATDENIVAASDLDVFEGSGSSSGLAARSGNLLNAYEGSGQDDYDNINNVTEFAIVKVSAETEDDDGSGGSGDGVIFVPHLKIDSVFNEESSSEATVSTSTAFPEEDITQTPYPLNIFPVNRNKDQSTTEEPQEVTEENIVPIKATSNEQKGRLIDSSSPNPPIVDINSIAEKESQATYILLGLLGFLLVGLIIFVIFRKKGSKRNNRNNKSDVENPTGTEMQDMNKELLGKPVNQNGNGNVEIIPLMVKDKYAEKPPLNGNSDLHKPPSSAEEPLLKKLNEIENEPSINDSETNNNNNNNNNGQSEQPIVPPAQHQQPITEQSPPNITLDDMQDDEVFMPVSPKPARYSPVYSPVTGRVKIKLTETPKPKTPMLVQRSLSNAGEIISTPIRHPTKQ